MFVPGVTLHLRHRGNNRCAVFGDDEDYEVYLTMLESAMRRHSVSVHAFALMTTHTHLQVTPDSEYGTCDAMKELGGNYVLYFNRKYNRVGTLWTGRYGAKPILDERYWLICLRYIEQNPVRAGIVVLPEQYRWSSYRAHAFGDGPDWLASHPVFERLGANDEERRTAYRALCAIPVDTGQAVRLRFRAYQRVLAKKGLT